MPLLRAETSTDTHAFSLHLSASLMSSSFITKELNLMLKARKLIPSPDSFLKESQEESSHSKALFKLEVPRQ